MIEGYPFPPMYFESCLVYHIEDLSRFYNCNIYQFIRYSCGINAFIMRKTGICEVVLKSSICRNVLNSGVGFVYCCCVVFKAIVVGLKDTIRRII